MSEYNAVMIAAAAASKGTIEALGVAASEGHTTSVSASELPMLSTITVRPEFLILPVGWCADDSGA